MGVRRVAEELWEEAGGDEGCGACCEEEAASEFVDGASAGAVVVVEETLRGEVCVGLAADHWRAGTCGGDGDEGGLCGA